MAWYIIHTFSGKEQQVRVFIEKHLHDEGFEGKIREALVPEETVREMRNGKKRSYKRKLFQGYVLVEMDFSELTYDLVRKVPGVLNFVEYNGVTPPKPLSRSEVKNLITKEKIQDKDEVVVVNQIFRIDEQVKVIDGVFKDFVGVVEEVNEERGRLKVRVEIFGRSTPVEVDFLQVEKV